MSRKRIVPTALALFTLSACGGSPTAGDPGVQPRFSGGVGTQGGGGRSGGGITSTQEGGGTAAQTDSAGNNRGGFIGSGG